MSFTKTISTVAALASIFGAAAAGWKLAQDDNKQPEVQVYEQRINELEKKIEQANQKPNGLTPPAPTELPQPTVSKVIPSPTILPTPTPPAPPEPPTP